MSDTETTIKQNLVIPAAASQEQIKDTLNDLVDDLSSVDGGVSSIRVADKSTHQLLSELVTGVKILNMHLAIINDIEITPAEVE